MIHALTPFPFGVREGELVVRITDIAGDDPVDVAGEIEMFYRQCPIRTVWCDLADVAGPGPRHQIGIRLGGLGFEVLAVGPVESVAWPFFSARLIVDVSGCLRADAPDLTLWTDAVTRRIGANPPATEIFAVAPASSMLVAETLSVLDAFSDAPDGATLYVAEQELARAVAAAARCPRPWSIRRLGSLPPRAPGAAPGG